MEAPSLYTAQNHVTIESVRHHGYQFQTLAREVSKVIVGQQETIQSIVVAILCKGHILLEGAPGLAKTTMIKCMMQALGLSFTRIQFTPDLLPSDLTGTLIYNQKTNEFETQWGPIFTQCLLADEINRSPAKVHSALLEAMQERQVTIGTQTYKLPHPFFVFATQNPLEQEGTYRLPEAQIDRFMLKVHVTYPTQIQEQELLQKQRPLHDIQSVLNATDIENAQMLVDQIYMDHKIIEYIVKIVFATRTPPPSLKKEIRDAIQHGVSPRGSLALAHAARAYAFLNGRNFVVPDDVKAGALAVLSHRITLTYFAESENITADDVIRAILAVIPSP